MRVINFQQRSLWTGGNWKSVELQSPFKPQKANNLPICAGSVKSYAQIILRSGRNLLHGVLRHPLVTFRRSGHKGSRAASAARIAQDRKTAAAQFSVTAVFSAPGDAPI